MKIVVLERDSVTKGDIDYSELERVAEIKYYGAVESDRVAETIADAEGVIVNKTLITDEIMEKCPCLKYVGTFATGYNNIDVECATKRGVTVCNVPAYSTEGVAQLAIAFMLYGATSLGKYFDSVARGDWKRCKTFCYYPYDITEVAGKTMGVYGFGSIGKRVAEIAKALGMEVLVYSRTKKECGFEQVERDELFRRSDFLSLHVPLSSATRGLINEQTLALMKPSAVLINTARGGLIDELALANALRSGQIKASFHDVINDEPMREDCPLFGLDNCFITPHVAWAAVETRQRLVNIAAKNVECFIAGTPQNVVNK